MGFNLAFKGLMFCDLRKSGQEDDGEKCMARFFK
jgi:hypothetical protein